MRSRRGSRLGVTVLAAGVVLSGCSLGGGGSRTYHAMFSRAVQLFPAGRVRVLGVNVGHIVSIANVKGGVEVTFEIEDQTVQLPSDVQAAIIPASLLGERYVQLFPAYEGGPKLASGATIPIGRTAVPVEPDEVLRSLQDYLGALDPDAVTRFVENAAAVLNGNGRTLNQLIQHGTGVMQTLASKRDDLARLITELNELTQALATRQEGISRLIQTYDTVASTLTDNRAALEGTITGLNEAAAQLASLLIAHQGTLNVDVDTLTRTGRTLQKNVDQLTTTAHWSSLLFHAASRAVDFDHDWLRLGNQGQEIPAMILLRLEQRLQMLCLQAGADQCATANYWSVHAPQLFCFTAKCPSGSGDAQKALADAIRRLPKVRASLTQNSGLRTSDGEAPGLQAIVDALLQQTLGNPEEFGGAGW